MQIHTSPSRVLIALALAITWLVWGSTFLAIHIATDNVPPLLLMGSRFLVAGILALAIGFARSPRSAWPTRAHWNDATIVGAGLITVSMGVTGWAATRLDTGITALLTAAAPLFITLLATTMGVAPTRAALAGLVIGLAGVALLMLPVGGPTAADPLAAFLLVLSTVGWAAASLYAARRDSPGICFAAGMQMLIGGALLLAASLALGELRSFHPRALDAATLASWSFLVVLGSLGGFLAYAWLLEHVSTTLASTHAFVNPLVAVALGTTLLGEPFGVRTACAGGAVVVAVVVIMLAARAETEGRQPPVRARSSSGVSRRPLHASGSRGTGRTGGWSPAPTPRFAARRAPRPWQATDGMDALAIDDALDGQL